VVGKLFRFFVHPTPDAELLDVLGERYSDGGYDTLTLLRMLFNSRVFYAERSHRALVKSPVILAVGAARTLPLQLNAKALADAVSDLGQSLYAPPSVKGWDGGHAWLNAATLIGRANLAADLAGSDGFATFTDDAVETWSVERWLDLLLDGEAPPGTVRWLEMHVDRFDDARGALQAMLAMPEYQLG
jgi:uncharacterized protein (DUF1800 family)